MIVAGLEAAEWLEMYAQTHPGGRRIEWPDGGAYLDQLYIVVEMWKLITAEINLFNKEGGKRE